MKKLILSFLTLVAISAGVNAQNVTIPDANFKSYLVGNTAINTNGDTEIQVSEASAYSGAINCGSLSISDLTGIEAFTALTVLHCANNQLTSLDVSANAFLTTIICNSNQLISLNVANGNNSNIDNLSFQAHFNPGLTCIQVDDVTYSTNTWTFASASFSLSCGPCTINIPDANFKAYLVGNTTINTNGDTEIQCSEASAYTGIMNCGSQSISDLTGIEAFTGLTKLLCYNNSLTSIDVSNNTSLTDIDCSNNTLTSLNISTNINLTKLICSNNSINNLDVSNNASLTQLWCDDNSITNLDISNNTSLTRLWCHNNSLSNLNVSSNINLSDIRCYNNSISSLNVSNCLALEKLKCGINLLTSLDVSLNSNLTDLSCADNSLTSLNAANGNNTNFSGDFGTAGFYTINNPNLTCIEVDDVAYSTTNWTDIDATSSFSTNCSGAILVSSITIQGQNGTSTITTPSGTLQMEATVLPANADDASYTWAVANGSGSATISASGLLTAVSDGTVTVTATANDGSGEIGSTTITISNQTAGIDEVTLNNLSIYPNPVQNQLFIESSDKQITELIIFDITGKIIKSIGYNTKIIDVSDLNQGVYMLKVATDKGVATQRFVKQ